MEIIHEITEIIGGAVAGGGGEITGHLIAPGAIKGIFQKTHDLHMGISHFFYIVGKLFGKLPVGKEFFPVLFPGAEMDLVNGKGSQRQAVHFYACPPRQNPSRCGGTAAAAPAKPFRGEALPRKRKGLPCKAFPPVAVLAIRYL